MIKRSRDYFSINVPIKLAAFRNYFMPYLDSGIGNLRTPKTFIRTCCQQQQRPIALAYEEARVAHGRVANTDAHTRSLSAAAGPSIVRSLFGDPECESPTRGHKRACCSPTATSAQPPRSRNCQLGVALVCSCQNLPCRSAAVRTHFCRESFTWFPWCAFKEISMTRALNRVLAKQNPEGSFQSPLCIVDEQLFTRGEKLATLNRWRNLIIHELDASGLGQRARFLK
jgi:hypothetical protein